MLKANRDRKVVSLSGVPFRGIVVRPVNSGYKELHIVNPVVVEEKKDIDPLAQLTNSIVKNVDVENKSERKRSHSSINRAGNCLSYENNPYKRRNMPDKPIFVSSLPQRLLHKKTMKFTPAENVVCPSCGATDGVKKRYHLESQQYDVSKSEVWGRKDNSSNDNEGYKITCSVCNFVSEKIIDAQITIT